MALEVDVKRRLGSFTVKAGFASEPGITALFGHSGAGKSSIINMISGLLKPESGHIAVDGRVLFDHARGINVPPRKRRVGYIFQQARLFPHLKVRRNLLYGRRFTPPSERFVDFDAIVDLLGIGHLLEQRPPKLSGGERQRVAIGRALLANPRLLLMDEPLASLDAARKNEILPYIERLRDQFHLPIVYVSHAFEEVVRLADRLVVMTDGQVAAAGSLTAVTSNLDVGAVMGAEQAGTVVAATVARHDDADGLTHLHCAGGEFVVPQLALAVQATVRVHIHALDVAIAVQRPHGLSIQNVLPARITQVGEETDAHVELRLDAGGMPIIAYVTHRAARELSLAPDRKVFALIKSVAISGKGGAVHTAATRLTSLGAAPTNGNPRVAKRLAAPK